MLYAGTFLTTSPRPELCCHCARLCRCACHTIPDIKHVEPCCGQLSQVHAMFCRNAVESLAK